MWWNEITGGREVSKVHVEVLATVTASISSWNWTLGGKAGSRWGLCFPLVKVEHVLCAFKRVYDLEFCLAAWPW